MSEKSLKPYRHSVQYYETDMMGITHHANYIRWMEEARIDFLEQIGFPYSKMEAAGVLSPVKALSCEYKHTSTFEDEISIAVSIEAFNGVVMTIGYEMRNQQDDTVFTARSEHVFLNREGRFVRMKREMPSFCETIEGLIRAE